MEWVYGIVLVGGFITAWVGVAVFVPEWLRIRAREAEALRTRFEGSAERLSALTKEFEALRETTERAAKNMITEMRATVGTFEKRLLDLETAETARKVQPQSWQQGRAR